jgi:hypothetical protein
MFKISGLQEMQDQLAQAQQALEGIDGELGTVNFDPHDPASVEAAIRSMEAMIDGKLGEFSNNSFVADLAEGMKERYREGILARAAEYRPKGECSQEEDKAE